MRDSRGTLGPGFFGRAREDNNRRYVPRTSARWTVSTVDGRRPMATLRIRPGRRKSAPTPQRSRSPTLRFGARWRERRRTISGGLRRRCSALTARTPPGLQSFAAVTAR